MASREINLISRFPNLSPEVEKRRGQLARLTPLVLGIYVLILLGVFVLSFILEQQLNQVQAAITGKRAAITALSANEAKYMLLKQKATAIKSILDSRYPYASVYKYFKNLETKGGTIVSVSLNETGEVSLNVIITNSETLNDYINSLLSDAEQYFRRVELRSVGFQKDGTFQVQLYVDTAGSPPL